MPSLKVINLGRLAYPRALYIQQQLFERVKQGSISPGAPNSAPNNSNPNSNPNSPNYLLLVEHDPVYTVGIRSRQYLEADPEEIAKLRRLGADFQVTNRGGLITFHGPGQLVAYPILNLAAFPSTQRSIKRFVCLLESVLIDVCAGLKVPADRLHPHPGVWVGASRKIAAIGIHASKYVTMHGVALNCNLPLDWYRHIVPCGIEGKGVTSLAAELGRDVPVTEVAPLFVEHFTRRLLMPAKVEEGQGDDDGKQCQVDQVVNV
ncbi:putative lipoyltransferase 2, mitochondrial [Tyrophagus putrescentiae]|nr:putative lipoyltransferase 2, mitochondrial [Tyrophagus putrescentiae]